MNKTFEEIFNHIKGMKIIDTHEHLPCFEEDRIKDTDVLKEYLSCYFNRDLVSAGLSKSEYQKVIDNKLPLVDRWNIVEPYWEVSRYTGYGRALDISVKELYGIDKICRATIEKLNNKFSESLKPGQFKKVLKDKSNIGISLLCVNTLDKEYDIETSRSIYCDKSFFKPVYMIDNLISPISYNQIEQVERESDIRICSFESWLEASEVLIDKAYKLGAIALKNTLAYERTLKYERITKSQAEEEFNNIFKTKHFPDWIERPVSTGKSFQDYMMHYILGIANRKNLTMQIHTGIQEGNGNIVYNSEPSLLTNLFLEYSDVNFDLFHIGYPYQNVLAVLAKNFPNVYIDMCWAHIISPNTCMNKLIEWIDTIPLNKIIAFGGDYVFIDAIYGHQYLARVNVAKALTKKVAGGLFNIDKAIKISEMFFYNNPIEIFKLNKI